MDAKQLSEKLVEVLDGCAGWEDLHIREVKTLEQAGIRLYQHGIFLSCAEEDGSISEFQITVAKSK